METRGIRNNNPANVRRTKEAWQGLSKLQTDKAFFQFDSMVWGIRCLVKTLHTYVCKHNLHSTADIINRFAPSNENNTQAYIYTINTMMSNKYAKVQLNESDFLNGTDMLFMFCVCICQIESKYVLTRTLFNKALFLANFKPSSNGTTNQD